MYMYMYMCATCTYVCTNVYQVPHPAKITVCYKIAVVQTRERKIDRKTEIKLDSKQESKPS